MNTYQISKGYFPKVGQTKKFLVEGLGSLKLTGIDVEEWDAIKIWKMEGYFDDFSFFEENEMDNPRVRIKIVGSIWLKSERMFKRLVKTYQYQIDEVIVNGETVMEETGRSKWNHAKYEPIMQPLKIFNLGGEDTQKECLNDIVHQTLGFNSSIYYIFNEYRPSYQKDETEDIEPMLEERKPFRIPIMGGIVALASAWIFKNR